MAGSKSIKVLPRIGGKLIVFEGVEGCGKTTQIQRTLDWLQTVFPSKRVVVTRQPGGTQLGIGIRRLLLDYSEGKPIESLTELLLYAADRAQHVEEVLKPELYNKSIILCDRYTDSTIAYQGYGRGLDLALIHQLNQLATGGLKSDLTIWLDVDVEVSLARTRGRGVADRIELEAIAFHRQVQQGYTELAKEHPNRILRVDASLNEIAVQEQIQAILRQHLAELLNINGSSS
ncbi:MAG TPA: dTMP kinase [Leptolyngbyaceae cyanobacterium]